MPLYFASHPVVAYDIFRTGQPILATNITTRLRLSEIVKSASLVYYQYLVKDGERPDTIAYKYYGDERLDWLIYLINEIHDPYFGWPMGANDLENFITQKYGSIPTAQLTPHHYEWIVQSAKQLMVESGDIATIPEQVLIVDKTTFDTLPTNQSREVSEYTYEDRLNEKHRSIHILDAAFVPAIEKRVRQLYPPRRT